MWPKSPRAGGPASVYRRPIWGGVIFLGCGLFFILEAEGDQMVLSLSGEGALNGWVISARIGAFIRVNGEIRGGAEGEDESYVL